jgi:hypothetical protein
MADIAEKITPTQEFLNDVHKRVFHKLKPIYDPDTPISRGELGIQVEAIYAEEIYKPLARTFVAEMLKTLAHDSHRNPDYSPQRMDDLWKAHTAEYARRSGSTQDQAVKTVGIIKGVFLGDVFSNPVLLEIDDRSYTISKMGAGLNVKLN